MLKLRVIKIIITINVNRLNSPGKKKLRLLSWILE